MVADSAGLSATALLPPLAHPGHGEAADQEKQPDQPGEHRQHADAPPYAQLPHATPPRTLTRASALKVSVPYATMRARCPPLPSSTRPTSPPVALASGASTSVVEVTSVNSRGLAGPTLASALSVPSVARQSPS